MAAAVDRACATLGFLIIAGQGVPENLIDDMRKTSFAYFDRPLEEKLKLHTDYGSLTVLKPDNGPGGLQVQKDGAWVDVPTLPETFVVNLGDLMAELTNDRWVSTVLMHRVVNPPRDKALGSRRLSMCFSTSPIMTR